MGCTPNRIQFTDIVVKQVDGNDVWFYRNNKYFGLVYSVYSNQHFEFEMIVHNGIKDGMYKTYYDNGQLKVKTSYNNDLINGPYELYSENGHLIEKRYYVNGKIDGKSEIYTLMADSIKNDSDFALKLSILKVPDIWKINETRQCQLKAINNGNITFTSVGNDSANPHKYAIKLSYRWVKLNDSNPMDFENRFLFPAPVKKELTFSTPITAPAEAGSYYLEIEAVQEYVAWFKDKGYPGIKVKVDVL